MWGHTWLSMVLTSTWQATRLPAGRLLGVATVRAVTAFTSSTTTSLVAARGSPKLGHTALRARQLPSQALPCSRSAPLTPTNAAGVGYAFM